MDTGEALRIAQEAGVDLVEVNPKASPPVCKILDFGKYKYEEKKKQREAKRKQTVVEVKEVKLRPKTDDHDLNVKARHAKKFIEGGNKVKITVRFRGREITHPEIARQQIQFFLTELSEIVNVEQYPTMEGRTMAAIVSPKPQVMQRIAQERAQREREGLQSGASHSRPDNEPLDDDELHEPDDDDDDDDDED
jgi:translation initiation factor IF-3